MKHIIKMDKDTKELQDNLKQHLVNIIMNENTFIRQVNYADSDVVGNKEQSVNIDYLIADEIDLD